jgi:hypothetical protein
MLIFVLVVAAVFGVGAISFNAGQHSPETKNIFSPFKEKN